MTREAEQEILLDILGGQDWNDDSGWCCAPAPCRGWVCSRPRGHRGKHIARGNIGSYTPYNFLEEWE